MHITTADAPALYSKSELNALNKRTVTYNGEEMSLYDGTQQMRKMEADIRDTRRELVGLNELPNSSQAKADFEEYSIKLKDQEAAYKDFCRQTKLTPQDERMRVYEFNKSLSQKAVWANKKHYQEFRKAYSLNGLGLPKDVVEYQDIKYNNKAEYDRIRKYVTMVNKNEISPLVGYDTYKATALEVEKKLLGVTTSTGVTVSDYSAHFIGRVIGHAATNEKYNRQGVDVDDILDALLKGSIGKTQINSKGERSITYLTDKCTVAINPDNGLLIQTNK